MEWYERIIIDQIDRFLHTIRSFSNSNNHTHFADIKGGFPIIVHDSAFTEQKAFDELIENKMWKYLLNGIFKELFSHEELKKKGITFAETWKHPQFTFSYVDEIEKNFPIEFIIDDNGYKTGYRYTNWYANTKTIDIQFKDKGINQLFIIDFSSEEKSAFLHPLAVPVEDRERVQIISLRDFIGQYFSDTICDFYITKVSEAVEDAYKYVGLKSIKSLSRQSLPFFTERTLQSIKETRFWDWEYKLLSEETEIEKWVKKLLDDPCNIISPTDFKTLKINFFDNYRYLSLAGCEDFARSFITSEYLYDTMTDNSNFDYTAIVCGYLKSVEQLVYKLVLYTLHNTPDSLWIKKNNTYCKNKEDLRNNLPRRPGKIHIRFKPDNKEYFDTTFGPLVNLLIDNVKGWDVSEGAKNYICSYLIIYKDECRNEHFHKDNIDKIDEVEIIRDNTWLLLYYLLGGYRLFDSDDDTRRFLGIKRSAFDEMYRSLMRKAGPGNYYMLCFENNSDIYAALPMSQEEPDYDENGLMNNPKLRFVRIERSVDDDWRADDWHEIEKDHTSDHVIYITPDNMPESIVYIDKNTGKQSEIWSER